MQERFFRFFIEKEQKMQLLDKEVLDQVGGGFLLGRPGKAGFIGYWDVIEERLRRAGEIRIPEPVVPLETR
ncbi:hypothetical protein [Neisseria chenwenguii]|uniref:Uncharacterized protein n=1 Tax=Neisseria chenwenguii TaxID=1853278 RepID=A0A220S1M3_9NEIS|nr:hypothetical protein [Neisseria chenwenguii]ASK27266.1 hypothetical protein BG910_05500 [Neisseria chenwenguii]ROV57058.1 hypothetical protein EGS38_02660 [Neisseria chenwenguii]